MERTTKADKTTGAPQDELRAGLLATNGRYAAQFADLGLAAAPRLRVAIVTCMDARLDPARFLGLHEGDAHVIRNAGGIVTQDVVRSLIVSHWVLGTEQVLVIGHTRCGMVNLDAAGLRQRLVEETGDTSFTDFLELSDLEQGITDSVGRVRGSRSLPASFTATGFIYDVDSGRLREVAE